MACARPVVGAAVGGLLDTVVDGVTGLLVPPRDPGAVAVALAELLADPALRHRMGQAGAARVAERYTWPTVAAGTEQIYRRIAAPLAAGKVF
jgi:glycosyltransferase involved in cell wall biosynthesis